MNQECLGHCLKPFFPNYLLEEDLKMPLTGGGGGDEHLWMPKKENKCRKKKYEIVMIFMDLERCLSG